MGKAAKIAQFGDARNMFLKYGLLPPQTSKQNQEFMNKCMFVKSGPRNRLCGFDCIWTGPEDSESNSWPIWVDSSIVTLYHRTSKTVLVLGNVQLLEMNRKTLIFWSCGQVLSAQFLHVCFRASKQYSRKSNKQKLPEQQKQSSSCASTSGLMIPEEILDGSTQILPESLENMLIFSF